MRFIGQGHKAGKAAIVAQKWVGTAKVVKRRTVSFAVRGKAGEDRRACDIV